MKHLKRQDGFTLVELVVGIACATMVMAAAAALLLMGARIQRTLRDEAKEQQTVRIVLTMLEDLVTEGRIAKVETTDSSWELKDSANTTLLTFKDGQLLGVGSSVLLDGINSAEANLHGNLLNFVFTTNRGTYETSTYCRTTVIRNESVATRTENEVTNGNSSDIVGETNVEKDARYAFLQTLCKEYGSTGAIQNGSNVGTYYSEWYIGGYTAGSGWNSSTPWCACFLSWAAAQHLPYDRTKPYIFADVDNGWNNMNRTSTPIPGDYIFFDWEKDGDPDHVGAVLLVNGGLVYTIEGNSGGRVAIHSYSLNDARIMGYGVLPWKST